MGDVGGASIHFHPNFMVLQDSASHVGMVFATLVFVFSLDEAQVSQGKPGN
jgi:hypothetical protein